MRNLQHCTVYERPFVQIEGATLLDFSSNDYLGFRFNEAIQIAYIEGIKKYGIGSGGSSLVCGYDEVKDNFERQFSAFLGTEKAVLLNSGYAANLAVFSTLWLDEPVEFFIDKFVHASIYDALKLRNASHTKISRYPHQDLNSLQYLLEKSSSENKVIVSEGIFSMSGLKTNIGLMVELKKKFQAKLIIDDAHAIGVSGDKGLGSLAFCQANDIDLLICPLGKAFAMSGAIIAAKNYLIDQIIQKSRPYIYSTAIGSAHVNALNSALTCVINAKQQRLDLENRIDHFIKQKAVYPFSSSTSAIQFLILGTAQSARTCSDKLKLAGFYCYPMTHPTVPVNQSGLRIVLNATHTNEQIDMLFNVLKECLCT